MLLVDADVQAQPGMLGGIGRGLPSGKGSGKGGDSLRHRTNAEDSITINFRYLDTARNYTFDSSVSDFTKRFPIPATHIYLGNSGQATHSLLFEPSLRAGWDPGFHAYDVYKWKLEDVQFFNTTRPYTELSYLLGTKVEQIIGVLHTQNIKPYWNVSFRYRLINSPGTFRNQKAIDNNYLITSWYESPSKRYNNYFVFLSNNMSASENGGVTTDSDYFNIPAFQDRSNIPTKIGGDQAYSTNFFTNNITTGNKYTELTLLMRQQYDLGRKDSIVTDSTVIQLFYPRLRFEHTLTYGRYSYNFFDNNTSSGDSAYNSYYSTYYHLKLPVGDSVNLSLKDSWRDLSNDFSIYQFPDAKNLRQFFKAGIHYQLLKGDFKNGSKSFYNFIGHGEYRNRTRNQKWDAEAVGVLYLNGYNAGDYNASVSLQRLISPVIGSLQVGFQNTNRTPSFIYNQLSSFYLDTASKSFSKENITHLFAVAFQPKLKLELRADYYLVGNYLYLTGYNQLQQQKSLFNVVRISALKTFKLAKHWNLYSEVFVQKETGNAPVNIPLVYTRNRLAFEGRFYKNLNISTGLEVRYNTPYKADGYSPVLGKFSYQDTLQISNRPEVTAFLHFRIRSFTAYFRAENLNTLQSSNGLNFGKNNEVAPGYYTPGLVIRLGIYWSFVN